MSFWSKLGKGLKIAAPVVAAPFTGGMSLAALPSMIGNVASAAGDALGGVGQVAGDAAKGAADQRMLEAQVNQGRDRTALDRAQLDISQRQGKDRSAQDAAALGINQNATRDAQAMQRAQLGIEAPMARTKQAAFGDALANVQDVAIDFQPTTGALPKFNVKGGLRPSMFGAGARSSGRELQRQALMALMQQSDVPAASEAITVPPPSSELVALPELTAPTKGGALEKTLGGVGLGGSILGALGDALKKRKIPTIANSGNARLAGLMNAVPGGRG